MRKNFGHHGAAGKEGMVSREKSETPAAKLQDTKPKAGMAAHLAEKLEKRRAQQSSEEAGAPSGGPTNQTEAASKQLADLQV